MDGFIFNGGGSPFPWMWMPRPGHQQSQEEREPPARVRVAMQFLMHLTNKTSPGAVPHGMGAIEIDGQKLVPSEVGAQTAACELLRSYFRGDLKPDMWEEHEQEKAKEIKGAGKLISCFLCQSRNQVDANCSFCKGTGTIIVYPTSEDK